ncbi:uncharacterized protein N7482_001336 [Penicillium canariense]|uniref:Uncharacterized protein n=1 Tax=Penicillium canariense TaxID=189055 RepID=A0A9W9LTT0_9EURO|nr:uncharacterized protein N7482_001336 [Penicillium canariense]KAJ5175459.1 hypothetical protein N7482_001336 [Penicillium canariense]
MESPPKRRRTREATGAATGVSQSLAPRRESRSPSRASFQSPTRASLARSHPEVLERAISRSPSRRPTSRGNQNDRPEQTDSRSVGLRGRKALRPSLNPSSPLKAPRMSGSPMLLSPSRRASGIQAFSKPPRRLSKRISATDFTFGSPIRRQSQPAEDLLNTPEGQLALELGTATQEADIEPEMEPDLSGGFVDDDSLEPDLPPTPTQLGLEKAPDRPRGLLSSSPSARHEKRMKRRTTDILQGSPLKTLKFQPPAGEDSNHDTDSTRDSHSAAVLEKQRSRKSLVAELRRLKDDVAELSKWAEKVDSSENLSNDTKELNKFLSLLREESSYIHEPLPLRPTVSISALLSTLLPFSANLSRPTPQASPLPTNPFALTEMPQAPSYLTVLAPLTLRAHTSRSASKSISLLETHTLAFSAPSPFPSSLYNVSVVYETNPETQTIISVSVPTGSDSNKRRVPEALRQWIDSRLENSLLALDVATLCWGINRYWEASVARAQLWARIDHNHGSGSSKRARESESFPESLNGVISVSEVRHLVPHLERCTMIVRAGPSTSSLRVLLSNALIMDEWTGEPQLRPELSVSTSSGGSGSSKKINREIRKLFHALLCEEGPSTTGGAAGGLHGDAILRATAGALGALLVGA